MSVQAFISQDFEGGWSTDPKTGIEHSFAFSQALDFRKNPSQMTVFAQPTREDANVMQDLVLNEVMAVDGTIYALGNTGFLYKRTTGGVWSEVGKLGSGTAGMSYRPDSDALYLTGNKTVSLYGPISGTPVLTPDKYGTSQSLFSPASQTPTVNPNQSGSGSIYTLPTAISETTTNRRLFQSDIEPLQKLDVYVVSKGTGDWTLTLHDGLNNVLATSTVTNANLTNNAFNDFAFSGATNAQVRLYISPNARTYHYHLTSTVADGTVATSVASDLSTCDMQLWADRLVQTRNGFHPMARFQQFECIGNGSYLSVWEPLSDPPTNSEWLRHKLVFPMQYEVCGLAVQNEFIIVAAEEVSNINTSTPQAGILFFWDGTSSTYNYFVPVPEGSPHSLFTFKNVAYYYAGGAWYAITSPQTLPVKIRTMPGSDTGFSGATAPIQVYPYSATVRRGVQLMAYPSLTTNTNINFGVYSWGAIDKNFPESFGYNYLISSGSQNFSVSNNLTLGMTQAFGDLLHISWRDDSNGGFGIDKVDNTSNPASYAKWQSMIFDNGYVSKRKAGLYMECYYNLPAGATIQMAYSLDRGAFVTDPQQYSTTNLWLQRSNYARFHITDSNGGRFNEIQLQLEVRSDASVTQPPTILQMGLVFDNLRESSLK